MRHWRRHGILAALMATLFYLGACATGPDEEAEGFGTDDNTEFAEWDDDQDGLLDYDEFEAGATGTFDTWDIDDDGLIDDDEFAGGIGDGEIGIEEWDEDGDGVLNDDEFGAGMFDTFDMNDDGIVDDEEFGADTV